MDYNKINRVRHRFFDINYFSLEVIETLSISGYKKPPNKLRKKLSQIFCFVLMSACITIFKKKSLCNFLKILLDTA